MKHRFIALLAGMIVLLATSSSSAFDGNRKGFVFGAGLGTGSLSIDRKVEVSGGSEISDHSEGVGFASRIECGFGSSQQLIYAFELRARSLRAGDDVVYPGSGGNAYTNVLVLQGGPTLTYYARPAARSFFFGGGPTIVFVTDELNITILGSGPKNLDSWGPGFVLKCGYEFTRHFDFSFEIIAGFPGETTGGEDVNLTLYGFSIAVNWLGY